MEKEEVAEALLEIGATTINSTSPFKYANGMLSPIYTNNRILISFPKERKLIIDSFIDHINAIGKNKIDVVVGAGASGISLATYIAERLNIPMAYTRSVAKDHGKGKQIEGIFEKGYRTVLVSDVMSTEDDIPIAVNAIRAQGGEVVFCISIFSNNLNIIENFLEKEGIKYHSLTDLKTLLTVATIKRKISDSERASVAEWMKNPENWDNERKAKLERAMKENKEKIAEILLKIKAVTLNLKQPYRYVSGILSPIYTDNRLLMSYPEEWKQVIDSFVNIIIGKIGVQNIDVIAGTATAGISHAAYLAEILGLPMIYVKSVTDGSVTTFKIEGKLKKSDRVLVLEDLISTGGSSLTTVKAIREAGGTVNDSLAIFTYGMEKAKKAYEDANVNLITLTDIDTLIDVASKQNYIKPEEKAKVAEWTKDTAGWGKKMGFE